MQQSPWEANVFAASQAIPCILWELEGSLLRLQGPATCPFYKLDKSSPFLPSHSLKMYFDITLPSMPGSSK